MLLSNENLCKVCFEFPCENLVETECGCAACYDCQQSWVRSQLEEGRSVELRCPMPECKCIFSDNQVKTLLSSENQELYQRVQSLIYLRESQDVRMCPIPKCEYAGFKAKGQYEFFCPSCNQCWEDKRTTLFSTLKNLKTTFDEATSALWVGVFCKNCPSCQVSIQKDAGCPHMTCWTCGHQFCWKCMDNWIRHEPAKCETMISYEIASGAFICMVLRIYLLSPEIYWFINLLAYYIGYYMGYVVIGMAYAFFVFSMLKHTYLKLKEPFREYKSTLGGPFIVFPALLYWLNYYMSEYLYISICLYIGNGILCVLLTLWSSKAVVNLVRRIVNH